MVSALEAGKVTLKRSYTLLRTLRKQKRPLARPFSDDLVKSKISR